MNENFLQLAEAACKLLEDKAELQTTVAVAETVIKVLVKELAESQEELEKARAEAQEYRTTLGCVWADLDGIPRGVNLQDLHNHIQAYIKEIMGGCDEQARAD